MELLRSNTHHKAGRLEQMDSLILSKEQERRRAEKHIDGIMLSMAEAGTSSRKLLAEKLDETVDLKTAIDTEIRSLKGQKSNLKGSVIELNDAVIVIRPFRKGFERRPVHEQKEILKDVMRSIMVHPDKLVLEVYGKEGEEDIPFDINEGLPSELAGGSSEPERSRTAVRTAFRVVEAAEYGTNHILSPPTYLDSIEFFQKCHWKNTANYRDLYLKNGLSAAQIGAKLNVPKQTVLNQLKREGIRLGTNKGRLANPENYRLLYAPYGFSKKDGRLIPNKSELKICRLVVQLRNDSKMSFQEIARELERRRIKSRTDSISWTHATMGRIYKRWNGKL